MVGHCGPTSDIGEYSAIAPIADKPEGSERIISFVFADNPSGIGKDILRCVRDIMARIDGPYLWHETRSI